jgi:hypothetical protein
MRAAVTIFLGSLVTSLTAMTVLRIFFSDVKPVAWGDAAQSSERLQTAFFLLTIENLAAFGMAIALAAILTLWACSSRTSHLFFFGRSRNGERHGADGMSGAR